MNTTKGKFSIANLINIIILGLFTFICVYPLWYIFINSFSSPQAINRGVYLIPQEFTLEAYKQMFDIPGLTSSIGIAFARTIIGTAMTLFCCSFTAYLLSDRDLPKRKLVYRFFILTMYAASLFTLFLCGEQWAKDKLVLIFGKKTGAWLNLAEIYLSAGLYEEGYRVLELCPTPTVLSAFYQAWAADKAGDANASRIHMEEGEKAPGDAVFPNRMFDFKVLQYVAKESESALAPYYMGCMYYARENDDLAAACWQLAVSRNPGSADAHRALAQVMFEAYGDQCGAKQELMKSLSCRRDARIFYEKFQMDKVTGASNEACLQLLEENRDLVEKRQDLTVQYIEQLCHLGRLKEAKELLDKGQFYSYEGGEGLVPGLHAFVHIALGVECLEHPKKGSKEEALEYFLLADRYPAHYHEGRKYQERTAHLHYFLSLGYEAVGDKEAAERELRGAATQYDNQGESQFFKGLALRKSGDHAAAATIFIKLKEEAQQILKSETLNFFLGFPAALPYEQSQKRTLEKMGRQALFYAQLGLGETEEAKKTAEEMRRKGLATIWVDYLAGKIVQGDINS